MEAIIRASNSGLFDVVLDEKVLIMVCYNNENV